MAQIFPQADDLSKIFKIIYLDESKLDNKSVMQAIKVTTERQVGYYISSCKYLDILDDNKRFTSFGNELKKSEPKKFSYNIAKKIVSKDVFGEVFFEKYFEKKLLSVDDIAQLIIFYTEVENHQVALRRAKTVIAWLKWIEGIKS